MDDNEDNGNGGEFVDLAADELLRLTHDDGGKIAPIGAVRPVGQPAVRRGRLDDLINMASYLDPACITIRDAQGVNTDDATAFAVRQPQPCASRILQLQL